MALALPPQSPFKPLPARSMRDRFGDLVDHPRFFSTAGVKGIAADSAECTAIVQKYGKEMLTRITQEMPNTPFISKHETAAFGAVSSAMYHPPPRNEISFTGNTYAPVTSLGVARIVLPIYDKFDAGEKLAFSIGAKRSPDGEIYIPQFNVLELSFTQLPYYSNCGLEGLFYDTRMSMDPNAEFSKNEDGTLVIPDLAAPTAPQVKPRDMTGPEYANLPESERAYLAQRPVQEAQQAYSEQMQGYKVQQANLQIVRGLGLADPMAAKAYMQLASIPESAPILMHVSNVNKERTELKRKHDEMSKQSTGIQNAVPGVVNAAKEIVGNKDTPPAIKSTLNNSLKGFGAQLASLPGLTEWGRNLLSGVPSKPATGAPVTPVETPKQDMISSTASEDAYPSVDAWAELLEKQAKKTKKS